MDSSPQPDPLDLNGPPAVLTPQQTKVVLACGIRQVYELCHDGKLAHVRIGKAIKIPKASIRRFLATASEPEQPANVIDVRPAVKASAR